MDTTLLSCVRHICWREALAGVKTVRARGPRMNAFVELFARRPYRARGMDGKAVVAGYGAATRRACDHLGIVPTVIRTRPFGWRCPLRILRLWVRMRAKHGAQTAVILLQFLLEYRNALSLLDCCQPRFIVVHTDYSMRSLALAVAGTKKGTDVRVFQTTATNRTRPPHSSRIAYAYTPSVFEGLAETIVQLEADVKRAPIRQIPATPVIGVALNNYIDDGKVAAAIDEMRRLPHADIIVRHHPNSKHATDEPLSIFLERCDVLIAGNTSTQASAILGGLPVIHVGVLDDHPFDTYGFVADGMVYGARRVSDISFADVAAFYAARSASTPFTAEA